MAKLILDNVRLQVKNEDGEILSEYALNKEELQGLYCALLDGSPQLDVTESTAENVYENLGRPHGDPTTAKLSIRIHWDVEYEGN